MLPQKFAFNPAEAGHAQAPKPSVPSRLKNRLRLAYGTVFFVGVGNIVLGWLLLQWHNPSITPLDSGITFIVIGAILLLLGFFVVRKSAVALGIAVALFALAALGLFFQGNLNATTMHLILLSFMIPGFRAIREIRNAEKAAQLQK